MAKHQIFLVHGMGNFEPGWSAGIKQQIIDTFGKYPKLAANHYVDNFEFKEINYDKVFENWRQQWKNDANKAAGALTALGLDGGAADNLVKLAQAPTGNSFWQTHVLDVVMYRYLMPLTEEVRRVVQEQIVGHIDRFPANARPSFSVIAHSLGTAVTYETFHAMLTDPGGLPIGYRPVNFFAIANVIRPLWNRGGTCYPPEMGPNLADHVGLCFHFGNYHHALDPFCHVDPFTPPEPSWFDPVVPVDEVYHDTEICAQDIQYFNVHAMEHYLSHPDVHVPILRQLVKWDGVITAQEHQAALVEWRKATLTGQALTQTNSALNNLLVGSTSGFAAEIDAFLKFRNAVLIASKKDGES